MIELPCVERGVLTEQAGALDAGSLRDRFADEARKREHAEPVSDAAQRVAP